MEPRSMAIGGVAVDFPAKPYPSQVSMMYNVIRGCEKCQNCLLESPTGSGKTLALLCSALAWQKKEAGKLEEIHAEGLRKERDRNKEKDGKKADDGLSSASSLSASLSSECTPVEFAFGEPMEDDEEEEDVFVPLKKKMRSAPPGESVGVKCAENVPAEKPRNIPDWMKNASEKKTVVEMENAGEMDESKGKAPKPPKIYFGTRTHKQITQVVKELRRTAYSNVRSTILSSRTHSCLQAIDINPMTGMWFKNKTEMCQHYLAPYKGKQQGGPSCGYYPQAQSLAIPEAMARRGFPSVWDLEDLMNYGSEHHACPYFMARHAVLFANIVFCPYNYLIDPRIRKSMNIDLNGGIIILDEAHNIEDTCRESASLTITQDEINKAKQDCEQVAHAYSSVRYSSESSSSYKYLATYLSNILQWMDKHSKDINMSDYNQGEITLDGTQAMASFEDKSIGLSNFPEFQSHLAEVTKITDKDNEPDKDGPVITAATKSHLENLSVVMTYMFNKKYTDDYHVCLRKTMSYEKRSEDSGSGSLWHNKNGGEPRWKLELCVWCFNPATVFTEIEESARCIILTSGTLAPIDSFQSELAASFPIRMEANHVIPRNHFWVGSLGKGPNDVSLNGQYTNVNRFDFQDELGKILLDICTAIPHGILCFFPSYGLMNKLYERWSTTGALNELEKHKKVSCEPRKSEDFKQFMDCFENDIQEFQAGVVGKGVTGVLLLAVCRGKISEGIDFADNSARVVVTVGIPYPNVRDSQVILKKKYNDKNRGKGLLSGGDWYQIQAFRALNQALGRCIRHKNDWGGILLIDNRFENNRYRIGLSKWLRNEVQPHHNYEEMMDCLKSFVRARLDDDENSRNFKNKKINEDLVEME